MFMAIWTQPIIYLPSTCTVLLATVVTFYTLTKKYLYTQPCIYLIYLLTCCSSSSCDVVAPASEMNGETTLTL